MSICDQDRIYAYVEEPDAADPVLEAHLGDCTSCMELFGSLQEFAIALTDAGVWSGVEPQMVREGGSPQLDHLVALSLRLEEEQERARGLIEELRVRPADRWHAGFRELDGVCTRGLATQLVAEARGALLSDPRRGLELADLAIEVAEALDEDVYPAGMVGNARGSAWKERANALRLLGRIQDALWSLDEAGRNYRSQAVPEFDLATIDYVRATALLDTDRVDEARALAASSATTFLEYGDTRRFLHARIAEASALYNLGSKRQARDVFLALLKPAQNLDDTYTLGTLFLNIAHVSVDLNDADMASIYFLQAAAVMDELGLRTVSINARWGLARLMLATGKLEEAAVRLRDAAQSLDESGVGNDAAMARLELAEALVGLGRFDEVSTLCRELIAFFTETGARRRALTALGYLKEAAQNQEASPKLVRHVRTYLERLPHEPELLFLPPPT